MKKLPARSKQDLTERMLRDPAVRRAIIRKSHLWFFVFYFAHYIKYAMAAFHREIFAITENVTILRAVIVAFRGSGKSTIITLSSVLWAIMGREQRKFVLIVGRTQEQAKQMLRNIRTELENNRLLAFDLGPFRQEEDEWRNTSLVIQNYGARITAVSVDQSVRGLRHNEHRPDLIICDDIEDLESVQTQESRSKTRSWVVGELIPAGDKDTRFFIVGNYLHDDSLTQRMRKQIEEGGGKHAVYRAYPLIDGDDRCLWREKFPDEEAILAEKARIGDEAAWSREYLLRIISDADRVVHPEWIQYYDELPPESDGNFLYFAIGIDLAISKKDTADYTAMVAAKVYLDDKRFRIYILPNPVNERLSSAETIERAESLADILGHSTRILVEDVGYQIVLAEQLEKDGYDAEGVKVKGQDKRARLTAAAHMIQSGQVLFPRYGVEELLLQTLNFGMEKHDDLPDALSMLLARIAEERRHRMGMMVIYHTHEEHDGFAKLGGFRDFSLGWM